MLNAYWAEVVPAVATEDGMIERFAGDAVLVVFNAATDQPDHAMRAARAALKFTEASEAVAHGRPEWPRFRVGVNSGPETSAHWSSEASPQSATPRTSPRGSRPRRPPARS